MYERTRGTEDTGMWAVKLSAGACAALLALAAVGSTLVAIDGDGDTGNDFERPLSNYVPTERQAADPLVTWSQMSTIDQFSLCNATEIADVNLDGYTDIVSSSMLAGIAIWLGDGGYNWTQATSPTTTNTYADVAIGDINNDGAMDIVGARNSGLYAWCKNKTTGGWDAKSTGLPVNKPNKSIILVDMNKDGNLDIVATGSAGGPNKAVSVYKGNGKGSWSNADNGLPSFSTYLSIAAADFNKDGNVDLAASYLNGVDAWSGDGRGNWTRRNSGLPISGSYSSVDVCDVDMDGNEDIVATSSANGGIRIWTGDGTGIWTMRLGLPTTGSYTGVSALDINVDGYPDVVASSMSNNQTVWTGDGAFNWHIQTAGLGAALLRNVAAGDLDGDARVDFCGPSMTGGITVFDGSALRPVDLWTAHGSPGTVATIEHIAVFDVNLDGKSDIAYATQSHGLQIFTGNGAGVWTQFSSPVSAGAFSSLAGCDFNRDGKPDIVAVGGAGIQAWSGNGAGVWTARTSGLPSSGSWLSLAVADYNDDGALDIAAGSGQGSGMRIYSGDGTGVWTLRLGLPLSATFTDIAAGDVNKDGDVDIVVAATDGARCYLGTGTFNWTQSSLGLPAGTDFSDAEISDANREGNIDIFTSQSGAGGVRLWLGDGAGGWSSGGQVSAEPSQALALGDANLDGDVDAAIGADSLSNGAACRVNGAGWASLSDGLPTVGEFPALAFADVNVDGRLDIIASNGTSAGSKIWVADNANPPVPWFNISVVAGWNLISIPLQSANESLPFSLSDKADGGAGLVQWDRVMWYNPAAASDPWKQYNAAWIPALNDLTVAQAHMGIWLHVTDAGDGSICVGGDGYSEFDATAIPLKEGWNLVGYPSTEGDYTIAELKVQCPSVDIVEAFNATAQYGTWTPPDGYAMKRGEGYWVHALADTVWNVP